MAADSKIRVGIVGANPSRGFASIAHIPALKALAEFEISAVCTTRQDSADAAAKHFQTALNLSSLPSERAFLAARLREVESRKQNSAFPVR